MNNIEEWVGISENDLKNARLCYDNKLYPQAVFALQQSVEKLVKPLALLWKLISEDELITIGHSPVRVFQRVFRNVQGTFEKYVEIAKIFPNIKQISLMSEKEIKKTQKEIEKTIKELDELQTTKFYSFDEHKIAFALTEIERVHKESQAARDELKSMKLEQKHLEEFTNAMRTAFESPIISQKSNNDFNQTLSNIKKMPTELYTRIIQISIDYQLIANQVYLALYYLSLFTMHHASAARYPLKDSEQISKRYDESVPLIKYLPQLMTVQENAINTTKEIIEIDKKLKENAKIH
ncbi:MAG: HEPN domain-containing protein [Candidatus Woesearchaeota archaeon]